MQRFRAVQDCVWLVAKRAGFPRDLRKMLVALVKYNQFRWETDILRDERCLLLAGVPRAKLFQHVAEYVEQCDPIPFPTRDDMDVKLQRVRVKMYRYRPARQIWRWLFLL